MSRPLLSIVIPTTRPHYLQYSLKSVLAQDFSNFEVIIPFNPAPGVQLGDLPADPRIRVITANRFLPMHENWEAGFSAARGEWVTLLGDDDCYISGAFTEIADALRRAPDLDMLIWKWGFYLSTDFPSSEAGWGGFRHFPAPSKLEACRRC